MTRTITQTSALMAAIAVSLVSLTLSPRAFAQGDVKAPSPPSQEKEAPPPGDPLGPDLFRAITNGNVADLKAVLAKGAKVEGRNWLEITPLIWAAGMGNADICKTLIDAGANVNTASRFGGPVAFAEMSGNPAVVRLLLDRGAKTDIDRADGITPLMTAAETGHVEILRLFLAHGAAGMVNKADEEGNTPLMYAARRGQTATARLLIDAGAKVNAHDQAGRTALMNAAMSGYAECASLLLAHKAQINTKDRDGNTALLLAARYNAQPGVILSLLRGGADRSARDAKGRTAYDLAMAHESPAAITIALRPTARMTTTAAPANAANTSLSVRARQAVNRSLPLIERGTGKFTETMACTSCHHQGVGLMATGVAKDHGFSIDRVLASSQIKLILDTDNAHGGEGLKAVVAHPEMHKMVPGVDMGEFTPAVVFTYAGLLAHGEHGGETQALLTTLLAGQQSADGKWGFKLHREPIQSSDFATTALSIQVLSALMPADRSAEATKRIKAAREWLRTARPTNNEDRSYRLLGLKWAGADAATIAKATADLRAAQLADGGWAQLPKSAKSGVGDEAYARSDAYATGQALYALNVGGGVPTSAAEYVRGVRFLLRTQDDDGSWFVTKRAVPVNIYFDAGFPHGQSQYISYGATCWATMALALAADQKTPVASVARK